MSKKKTKFLYIIIDGIKVGTKGKISKIAINNNNKPLISRKYYFVFVLLSFLLLFVFIFILIW